LYNRPGKKNYTINVVKKKVTDQEGNDQIIDSVYEDIENLYNIIKNYEIMVNIKQIDEKIKSFGNLINEGNDTGLEIKSFKDFL
jgi:flagellar biosynthesis regulator FlbT